MSRLATTLFACSIIAASAHAQDEAEEEPLPVESEVSFFDEWSGNISLGLYGSDGNTERFSFRGEVDGERETDDNLTNFLTTYTYAEEDGDESENRFSSELENDFKLNGSDWYVFASGQYEHDEFKDWEDRLSLFAGPGYVFVDNDKTRLSGQVGAGAVREWGGGEDGWRAEGVVSAELDHKFTERQSISASVDYYPSLEDAGEYRIHSRAVYEILVDPEVNMSLRAGVEDRYDSDPGDADHNDVDYFIMLVWAY